MMHRSLTRILILVLTVTTGLLCVELSAQPENHKVEILQPVTRTYFEPANVLTVNTGNLLRFQSADTSIKAFLVNASQGTVKQEEKDFILVPEKTGELEVSIYNYNDIENPVLIERRKMIVVNTAEASVAGKNGGNISKAEFLKAEKIDCSGGYTITEFKLSAAGKAIDYKEFQGKGDSLSAEMIAAIQLLKPGEKIFIEFIRAKPENSAATRQIAPLTFTLTD